MKKEKRKKKSDIGGCLLGNLLKLYLWI